MNPNDAAFFFDDGSFINLDRVTFVEATPYGRRDYPTQDWETSYTTSSLESRQKWLHVDFDGGDIYRKFDQDEFDALSNALRVYHSKA